MRTDLGGENVEVWRYMVEQHASSNAVITCVCVLFADTLRALEADGHL